MTSTIRLKPLADQVMLITGASSGIGLVTAKLAAARGARVVLVARNEASLRDAVAAIAAEGGDAIHAVADVGDIGAVRRAASVAVAHYGRIDTWVNNAGTAIYARLVDTPLAEHEQLFRTNYFGTVHGALTAVDHLRTAGGAIVTVGSISSDLPSPILSAYSASKHAVKGFVDALRMELAADGVPIAITLIKPSGIDTPIAQHAANHVDGEALIPPLVYDPILVAEAILDAAQTVRRDVTVGGVGRLQVLLGTHFPAVLDTLSGLLIPAMSDKSRPKTRATSLFRPEQPGQERSGVQPGRKTSLYTAAERHPGAVGLAALAGAAGAAALVFARTRTARTRSHGHAIQTLTEPETALLRLSHTLVRHGYRHVTPTPETHQRVLARAPDRTAASLTDIFGWSLPFAPGLLPSDIADDMRCAGMLDTASDRHRSKVRLSTVRGHAYLHSAYPTSGTDAVFLGPDSYRFADLIADELTVRPPPPRARIVDIGVGAGVGAVTAATFCPSATIVATDINAGALGLARVNAAAAGFRIETVETSGLDGVSGPFDLALLNPPYLMDDDSRAYRDGGAMHGAQLPFDLSVAALGKLSPGGRLILYTGSAIVDGADALKTRLAQAAADHGCTLRYREIDPDVFGEELDRPQYRTVDRIALVSAIFTRDR